MDLEQPRVTEHKVSTQSANQKQNKDSAIFVSLFKIM